MAEDFGLVNSHPFNVASWWFRFCSNARDLGALIPLRKATSRRTRDLLTENLDSRAIDVEGLHVAKALLYQQHICSLEFKMSFFLLFLYPDWSLAPFYVLLCLSLKCIVN